MDEALWWSIFGGFVVGAALRWAQGSAIASQTWVKLADRIVIFCVVPLHVALTLRIVDTSGQDSLKIAAALGALLPLLTYLAVSSIASRETPHSLALTGASFGGGNRGVWLVSLVSLVAPEFANVGGNATLLDHFAVMDYAYFFVFCNALVLLHFGKSELLPWQIIPLLATAAYTFASSFLGIDLGSYVSEGCAKAMRYGLGVALAAATTMLVMLRIEFRWSLAVIQDLATVFVARAAVLLAFLGAILASPSLGWLGRSNIELLLIPLGVFLIVPPSSYIGSFVSSNDSEAEASRITTLAGFWSILFYAFVAGFAVAFEAGMLPTLEAALGN